MKLQKGLALLATLSLFGLSVACNSGGGGSTSDRYAEGLAAGKTLGYTEGYDVGYDDGYADGDEAGYARAKAFFMTADYTAGFNAGKSEGITIGYANGYTVGKTDGAATGYTTGYNAGYDDGEADGYELGYDDGYDDGSADGYDIGYDAGFDDGYDVGYDDGFDDGYALSVGKTANLKGYANVISMFHNDLIDYKKIQAPKQTKRGLVVHGQLLLSETSLTNKDTLKRAAVVEQYLVVEMAKQVKGKFGLSAERSLKVAKAANHFRKYSSKRALTSEDTNAYASEIIGSDFAAITKAYENGMKGDLSALTSVIEKAAVKNETSPEKMAEIMSSLFM